MDRIDVDVVIFGGGAAGLWLLDTLRRHEVSAVLVETGRLGSGQTVASQGIIHGGLKYSLWGTPSASARTIREMPSRWSDALASRHPPDLSRVRVRGRCCHLWGTRSAVSRLGLLGAHAALRTRPSPVDPANRPVALRDVAGPVYRVDEPVIDPRSLLTELARRNSAHLIRASHPDAIRFDDTSPVATPRVRVDAAVFHARYVVLSAGVGNEGLRQRAGLAPSRMQRRPLRMGVARGTLPWLNGHCVAGTSARLTITSDTTATGQVVWQIGGQVAEEGLRQDPATFVATLREELAEALPGLNLDGVQWGSYCADRAEPATADGRRPEGVGLCREGNILTAWPTKLALVPALADRLLDEVYPTARPGTPPPAPATGDTPWSREGFSSRPDVAAPPWEAEDSWNGDG